MEAELMIMKNYTIMPLNTEHIDEICLDIKEQVESGVAYMPLFVIKLVPEGKPCIDKASIECGKYVLFKHKLDAMGIKNGILVQCTMGHGYKLDEASPFTLYVGLKDGKEEITCCPYDEGFREYIKDQMKTLAGSSPDTIMVDDDFRLIFRTGGGCTCELHMKEVNRRAGKTLDRASLYELIKGENNENGTFTKLFIDTQRDALLGAAKAMREGIDSIDPTIPGSYCCCGPNAEFADEIAAILAGKGNPRIVRINNGNYLAGSAREMSYKASQRAALSIGVLKGKVDYILAETDTCPQNRYSTSAALLHTHFTASILEGCNGAKHWITKLNEYEPESGTAYRKKLAKYRGFYEELSGLVPTLDWQGCRIPIHSRPTYSASTLGWFKDGNTWGVNVLEKLGFPLFFSSECKGVTFLESDSDMRMTDGEIAEILKGDCVLSSASAKRLNERGFGEYIGVSVGAEPKLHPSYETVENSGKKCTCQHNMLVLSVTDPAVKVLSTVYHVQRGTTPVAICPGCTSFKNKLGGTVMVFAGTSDFPFHYSYFSMLTETRKKQFTDILSATGKIPAYYPYDGEVFLKTAFTPDGSLFCSVINENLDPLEGIPLVFNKKVSNVEMLLPDGSRKPLSFIEKDGVTVIDAVCYTADPVILFVK